MILNHEFYENKDVISLAQKLLGMVICTNFCNEFVSGIILETEAYKGPEDKACHAYQNKKTKRNEAMFEKGGILYIYLCYGLHCLCNIVTGPMNYPHAILIRSIKPISGISIIEKRRRSKYSPKLTRGPGNTSQALGLNRSHNKISLIKNDSIWIESHNNNIKKKIFCGPRVGINYAKEYALLPWRFWIK